MFDRPLDIVVSLETDGRYIARVPKLPGVLAYGRDADDAVQRVQAVALRFLTHLVESEGALLGWPFFKLPHAA